MSLQARIATFVLGVLTLLVGFSAITMTVGNRKWPPGQNDAAVHLLGWLAGLALLGVGGKLVCHALQPWPKNPDGGLVAYEDGDYPRPKPPASNRQS